MGVSTTHSIYGKAKTSKSNLPKITQLGNGWARSGTQVCLIEIFMLTTTSKAHSKPHKPHCNLDLNSRYLLQYIK